MTPTLKSLLICAATMAPSTAFADWTGGYVGLGIGTSLKSEVSQDSQSAEIDGDDIPVFYGGYQLQQNDFVFGGEIAMSRGENFTFEVNSDSVDFNISDFKGRAGYAIDNFLVYGVLGFTTVEAFNGDETFDGNGPNFGFGADYRMNDRFLVGGEYLARRTTLEQGGYEADLDIDTLSLRASYTF